MQNHVAYSNHFYYNETVELFLYTTGIDEACDMHQDFNVAFICIISHHSITQYKLVLHNFPSEPTHLQ